MNLLRATGVLAVGLLGLFLVHPAPGASQATTSCEDVDFESPFETVLLCAQQGHAFAQYNLGLRYAAGAGVPQDDVQALRWFRLAAEQGFAEAQFSLGFMYANGRGVPQDDSETVRWYRLAAEQGYASAQSNLGFMYANGRGVPQDDAEAVRWYRLAAEQGVADAQGNLGSMYGNGRGVSQDYVEAHMWANLAAAQSSGEDRDRWVKNRDINAANMTAEQIAEARRLAREWDAAHPREP